MILHPDCRPHERRPLIRRGRHLVVGDDLEKRDWRQFYVCAMRGMQYSHWLQLTFHDPCSEDPVPLQPDGPFVPTVEDRLYMAEVIEHYNRLVADCPDIWLNLGVFPWEPTKGAQISNRRLSAGRGKLSIVTLCVHWSNQIRAVGLISELPAAFAAVTLKHDFNWNGKTQRDFRANRLSIPSAETESAES